MVFAVKLLNYSVVKNLVLKWDFCGNSSNSALSGEQLTVGFAHICILMCVFVCHNERKQQQTNIDVYAHKTSTHKGCVALSQTYILSCEAIKIIIASFNIKNYN